MRTKARWLQSATMMAFLAVVALFVSPVLALNCCCDQAPSFSSSATATPNAQGAHCHGETAVAMRSPHAEKVAKRAAVRARCDCDAALSDVTFVAVDNARFFAPLALALPARITLVPFFADARRAAYAHFAARPRLPDRNCASGRAPPALAAG